ncbi:family 43 glycosylhydrolase [Paenibacillus sp. CGMCC 1.16610]|uniref:Family 43 glycosylhydrolase n=2 Tax=Paenibacillus TaxID=44249 RepID=A0ABW9UIP6_9BACL|nr:family 43 glycosylhydrolase [Paenibacillus sp. CGMCC 1.16610]MVQ40029.1 family 43 glycosylhydrolase [Paenibacillus anseongense]
MGRKDNRLRWKKAWIIALAMCAAILVIVAVVMQSQLQGREEANRMEVTLGQTYQNPIVLDQEWEDYGIGDPYILRFNGKYYLYCSTKDRRVGVKAWSSDDLVNWRYEGLVTEEPVSEGAYAPEVVYWNGAFYMYTSPAGKGHYVLQSDKPTGPFVKKTDNLGFTIDGSVFIDDDEKWYFTHAKFGGIMISSMSNPFTIDAGKQLNASLGHWTEGSMIIKRNGRYFITYTGNHVFSKGYRVNYGVNHESPAAAYTIPGNNPILISTANDFNGLGHSATVMGPNLDSYYIVYHNLMGRSAEGPPVRKMNLDRLVFNGDKMSVLGPTHGTPQEAPEMPEFRDEPGAAPSADKWEKISSTDGGETLLTRNGTGSDYTVEYNFQVGEQHDAPNLLDTLFAYTDSGNFWAARINGASMELALIKCVDGSKKVVSMKKLPQGTDLTKLHTIRVETGMSGTMIYWDGLLKIEYSSEVAKAGRIGYLWPQGTKPGLHYTAFSNEFNGSSDRKVVKPLPGTMEAVHGIQEGHPGILSGITPDGSDAVSLSGNGDGLRYPVNIRQDGSYLLAVNVSKASAGSTIWVETNEATKKIKLDSTFFAADSDWTKIPLGVFELKQGTQWLSLRQLKGEITLRYVEANLTVPVPEQLVVKPNQVGLVNRFGGEWGWADFTVSFEMTMKKATADDAGILLRTTNESEFKDQVKDAFMGYALSFHNDKVNLSRVSYENAVEEATGSLTFEPGQTRKVTVKLEGPTIAVFSDANKEPLLRWTDPNTFLNGRIGLRGVSPDWAISPLTVTR